MNCLLVTKVALYNQYHSSNFTDANQAREALFTLEHLRHSCYFNETPERVYTELLTNKDHLNISIPGASTLVVFEKFLVISTNISQLFRRFDRPAIHVHEAPNKACYRSRRSHNNPEDSPCHTLDMHCKNRDTNEQPSDKPSQMRRPIDWKTLDERNAHYVQHETKRNSPYGIKLKSPTIRTEHKHATSCSRRTLCATWSW